MSKENPRTESLFWSALAIAAPEERARYLDESCGSDQQLRDRIEELLAAYPKVEAFLERPAPRPVATIDEPMSERPGTVIGPYKLLERIGEGGMGTVWMAQQQEPVKRVVAMKLIKAGMDSKQVIARFEAERQALALMDHPNIAKVLDAGTTKGESGGVSPGKPYFVMDLVKGVPITRFCDEHHLTPRQRLELFVPVCQAVQHAHHKGIIHRDLKPSNVLVALYDSKPVPKVIDFGVAKAAGQALTEQTLVTGFGNIVGTLEYMSPEQAELNQLDIDTRSDIYSLGVLLYELLAGSPPFARKGLEKAGMLEMLRVIREQEPSKPSTKLSTAEGLPTLAANRGTEPAKLTKLVQGELDWIVMKALEKDRSRRYETANGFAMDLQRYLSDEPVLACPPSAGYRLRKFVRRNRTAVLMATAVSAALLVGTAVATWQAIVATRARADLAKSNDELAAANQRERQRFDLAMEAIQSFHTGVSEDVLLKQQEFEPLRKKLLGGAAEFYRKLQAQLGAGPDARSRAALASAYGGLGNLNAKVGSTDQALREYATARETYEALIAAAPEDPAPRRELVKLLINTADPYFERKEQAEYRRLTTLAVAEAERLVAIGPDIPDHLNLLAQALVDCAAANFETPDEEERLARRAMGILESLSDTHPKNRAYRNQLARACYCLSYAAQAKGRYAESVAFLDRVIEIRKALHHDDPTDESNRKSLARAYSGQGSALYQLGQLEESVAAYHRQLEVVESLAAELPAVIDYQKSLASAQQSMASMLWNVGRREDALGLCRRQLGVLDTLASRHPDRPDLRSALASALANTAVIQEKTGRIDEVLPMYRRAVTLLEALVKAHPQDRVYPFKLAYISRQLGLLLTRMGRSADGIAAFEMARNASEAWVKLAPNDAQASADLVASIGKLGLHMAKSGRTPDGLAALGRARELAERLATDPSASQEQRESVAFVNFDLALVLRDSGDEEGSLAAAERALASYERLARAFPKTVVHREDIAHVLSLIGLAHQRGGRVEQARAELSRSRDLWEQLAAEFPNQPEYRDSLGRALANVATLESRAGDLAAELSLHQRTVAIREKVVADAPGNRDFQRGLGYSLTYLGRTYRRLGKRAEAGQALERALSLVEPLIDLRWEVALVQVLQLMTRFELGMLRLAEGQPEVAASHFARAIKDAVNRSEPSVEELVALASVHSQASLLPAGLAAGPNKIITPKAHADRAMELLDRAVKQGLGDAGRISRSDDYEPLRERDDFKKLVAALESKIK